MSLLGYRENQHVARYSPGPPITGALLFARKAIQTKRARISLRALDGDPDVGGR